MYSPYLGLIPFRSASTPQKLGEQETMKEKLPYWASVLLSAVAIVLLVVNISLANSNRVKQADLSQRQTTITEGQSLAQFNQGLVQALAETSLKNNDLQVRDLLTGQGITLKSEPTSAPAPASDSKPADKK